MVDYIMPTNVTDLAGLFQSVGDNVSYFFPVMLIVVWLSIMIAGANSEKRRYGTENYGNWTIVSSVITYIIALLFFSGGFIPFEVLVIGAVFTLVVVGIGLLIRDKNV